MFECRFLQMLCLLKILNCSLYEIFCLYEWFPLKQPNAQSTESEDSLSSMIPLSLSGFEHTQPLCFTLNISFYIIFLDILAYHAVPSTEYSAGLYNRER